MTLAAIVGIVLLLAAPRAGLAQTFVVGLTAEPVQLDPAVVSDGVSLTVTHQIFDTLVRLKGSTTEIEPGLAERWESSRDGLTWTFHLRRGVRFHDGAPLDAAAVVWNIDRWRQSRHAQHANQIQAGQTFEYWESLFDGFDDQSVVARAEAAGPEVVRLTLRRPLGPLLANLAVPGFGIASPRAVEAHGTEFGKHPVGSGPFRFVGWKPGVEVVLAASPDSWGPRPRVSRVVLRPIKDHAQRLLALRAGEVHLAEGLHPDDLDAVRRDPGLVLVRRPALTTGWIVFNHRVREFRDRRVRRAFAHAVDKRALVRALYGGTGLVATQFQPPVLWGHDPSLRDYGYEPGAARRLLSEAGFPQGLERVTWEDGATEPLALWYLPVSRPYFPAPREIAQALAADLARAGIRARLETVDWAAYLDRVKHGRLALFMLGWIGDSGDPDNCLCYVFCTPGAPAQGFYANEEVARLLGRARALSRPRDRAPLYRQAERLLHEDVGRLPIAHAEMPVALSRRVSGYVPNPTGAESYGAIEVH